MTDEKEGNIILRFVAVPEDMSEEEFRQLLEDEKNGKVQFRTRSID